MVEGVDGRGWQRSLTGARVVVAVEPVAQAGVCGGGVWWTIDPQGAIVVRDRSGAAVDSWLLGDLLPGAGLAVDPRHRYAATSDADGVTVAHADGRVAVVAQPHWEAGRGAVAPDPLERDRPLLWSLGASEAPRGWTRQPPGGVVDLVDATTGAVVDRWSLGDDHPEGYHLLSAPEGVVAAGFYGQDGVRTWCLRADQDGRISHADLGWGGVPVAVDPESGEILFLPHYDELEVRSWWGGARQLVLDDELAQETGGLGYGAAFVDPSRAVLENADEQLVLIDRRDGAALGWLDVAAAAPEQVGPGRLLLRSADAALLVEVDPPGDRTAAPRAVEVEGGAERRRRDVLDELALMALGIGLPNPPVLDAGPGAALVVPGDALPAPIGVEALLRVVPERGEVALVLRGPVGQPGIAALRSTAAGLRAEVGSDVVSLTLEPPGDGVSLDRPLDAQRDAADALWARAARLRDWWVLRGVVAAMGAGDR